MIPQVRDEIWKKNWDEAWKAGGEAGEAGGEAEDGAGEAGSEAGEAGDEAGGKAWQESYDFDQNHFHPAGLLPQAFFCEMLFFKSKKHFLLKKFLL